MQSSADPSSVGAYDAKTRFSQLLERVEAGEEITITRHGRPVARLVPAKPHPSVENRQAAIRCMREVAARNRLDGLTIRELMNEGRR